MQQIEWKDVPDDGSLEISERLTYATRLKSLLKYSAERECDKSYLSDADRYEVVKLTQTLLDELDKIRADFKKSKGNMEVDR